MDHFNLLLTRVLKHRGARRREYIRQIERLHFVVLTKDENEKTELRRELVNAERRVLEHEEELEKTKRNLKYQKQTAVHEMNYIKTLQTDLDQVRKLRKQDKDKKEEAEKKLQELKTKLKSLVS